LKHVTGFQQPHAKMVARVVKVWVTVAIVATAATMYSRHHLENFKRHDWGQSVYIEDHVNGEYRRNIQGKQPVSAVFLLPRPLL
jgi:hypothetical protein